MTAHRPTSVGSFAIGLAALAGCSDTNAPVLATEGGGFLMNYRLAEAYAQILPVSALADRVNKR